VNVLLADRALESETLDAVFLPFRLFNTPELLESRAQTNVITDPALLYNQFRSGIATSV
jgi:hypothetical protein